MNKKVYMILSEQYMPKLKHYIPVGLVEFVFSSRKQAERQMQDMYSMINNDKYYMESSDNQCTHVAEYPKLFDNNSLGIVMAMKVNHSNGTYTIYTLQERELNKGYFKK